MKIICVGRNYVEHITELENERRDSPVIFLKPETSIIHKNQHFFIPSYSNDVHHEIEMVVALKSGGPNISTEDALNHVYGYGVGLDMTRRDLQGIAKEQRRPWEPGKSFERSAPMTYLIPVNSIGHPTKGRVVLSVNGKIRQEGDLNQMIWKVPEMIAYLSRFYDIGGGDLIMSGTPSGVGPVVRGDVMEGTIERVGSLKVKVI